MASKPFQMNRLLNLGIFPVHCLLIIGDKKYAQKVFQQQDQNRYNIDQFDWDKPGALATTYNMPCGDTLVWCRDDVKDTVLAHEFFHVVCHVMRTVGIPLSDDSEEAYAYTLQHLMKQAEDR